MGYNGCPSNPVLAIFILIFLHAQYHNPLILNPNSMQESRFNKLYRWLPNLSLNTLRGTPSAKMLFLLLGRGGFSFLIFYWYVAFYNLHPFFLLCGMIKNIS